MKAVIEIIPSVNENRVAYIKLSKAKEGKTGSATFLFIRPQVFTKKKLYKSNIKSVSLICKNKKISTNLIEIFFKNGQPFCLKAIFIFSTKEEYFSFFQFLILYSKQNNLSYLNNFKN